MEPFGHDVEHSFRTSRKRHEAVVALSSLSEAYPGALARAIGVTIYRLDEIMHGRPPSWSVADSPIALKLAEERWTERGRVYHITSRGRRKARQWTARAVRAEVGRRAIRAWARGGTEPMSLHPSPGPKTDGETSATSPSSGSSSFSVTLHLRNP